jgi:hypothetical protein
MDAMQAALEELSIQESKGEKKNFQATATKHGLHRTTLSKRFHGKTGSKADGYNSQQILTPGQTKALIKYINNLTERGLAPTHQMVQNLASAMAGKMPGINWASHWVKQHSKVLKSAYLLPIDKNRKRADSALYYSLYFELLGQKIKQYNIKLGNTWNMDKKGFLMGQMKKLRRIFSRSAYKSRRMQNFI